MDLKLADDKNTLETAEKKGILKVARNLLSANIDIETIKLTTGLTDTELANLTNRRR